MTERKCNHDPRAEVQTCVTLHQCVECKSQFMGSFRDGRCLSCYPIYAAARSTLAQKVLDEIAQHRTGNPTEHIGRARNYAIDEVADALRELFQREGIEVK